jgi:hypothetical protein
MDGWMNECINGWMKVSEDGRIDYWMVEWKDEKWMDGCLDGWMESWMGGWMGIWMNGWMDGWING